MIEVEITKEMLSTSQKYAQSLGKLNNSIRSGEGNIVGFLGEECVLRLFPHAERDNDYHHDLFLKGKRLEVKTKDRTVMPKSHYECSIAQYSTFQDTDYYVFVSLLRQREEYVKGYILGYMKKSEYFIKAKLLKKGDLDPSNNFIVKADCWNLPISELHKFERDKHGKSSKS
jgi:hypothetical protein